MTAWHAGYCQNKVLDELHSINSQFIQDFMHNDTSSRNEVIHPTQFLYIDANGRLNDRSAYMKYCASGYDKATLRDFRCADENIRVFGNTAIIVAKTEYMCFNGNYWSTGATRYTDTYVKEHGRWLCIQAQLTKINQ
jgi:hypothetical protein